jgi:hypothetical protein
MYKFSFGSSAVPKDTVVLAAGPRCTGHSGCLPLSPPLVGATVAVPQHQLCSVVGVAACDVNALVGVHKGPQPAIVVEEPLRYSTATAAQVQLASLV